MRALGRDIVGAALLLGLACCSLVTSLDGYVGGDASSTLGGDASSPPPDDAGTGFLQDSSVTVVDGCNLTGCFDMPLGFSLVALGAKGADCPSGFVIPTDTVEGPTVGAGACTCGCNVTTPPTCPGGVLAGHFGGTGTLQCASAGGDLANSGCGTDGFLGPFATGNEHRFTPPPATGGACNASGNKDATKLTFSGQGRVCQASTVPRCNAQVCRPPVTGGYSVCIAAAGDVACPSSFPTKHRLGVSGSFTCSQGCTCSVTAKCKGKLSYFASAGCAGDAGLTVTVDDTCQPTVAGGASFVSHIYAPDPVANVACNNAGSSAPSTPAVDQLTTVCCN